MINKRTNEFTKLRFELEQLDALDRQELADLWIKQFKHPPPKGTKRGLLERAEAYRLQAKRHGKLKPELRRRLIAISTGSSASNGQSSRVTKPGLGIGTKLIREWHGKTHEVLITDTGFVWNGETYRSLSAIAFAITEAKWSGPRFFGTGK
jgi:hypothetical protein